nr:hypothetical protein [Erythrotrichia welwitschii]
MKKEKNVIRITEKAQKEIQNLSYLQQNDRDSDRMRVRIGVREGGCSGMSYFINVEVDQDTDKQDQIIQFPKFSLVCDNKSMLYLYGTLLDYKSSTSEKKFIFNNPNTKQTCECGNSFRPQ